MALVISFTMVLVATPPLHLLWLTAYLWEFDGPTLSGGIHWRRTGPVPLYAWHGTESLQARSDRAETGLIGRSPTAPVDTIGIYTHWRGITGSFGIGSGGCMGREGGREFGFCVRTVEMFLL